MGSKHEMVIGRIVHYRFNPQSPWRPAIVVAVFSPTYVNLQVFTDGRNDGVDRLNVEWATSVSHTSVVPPDYTGAIWCWPDERAVVSVPGPQGAMVEAPADAPPPLGVPL